MTSLAEIERRAIESALETHSRKEACRVLGIGRATLYRKLQSWRTLDRLKVERVCASGIISEDELACILKQITIRELAKRDNCNPHTASKRVHDALQVCGLRWVRWGLALRADAQLDAMR